MVSAKSFSKLTLLLFMLYFTAVSQAQPSLQAQAPTNLLSSPMPAPTESGLPADNPLLLPDVVSLQTAVSPIICNTQGGSTVYLPAVLNNTLALNTAKQRGETAVPIQPNTPPALDRALPYDIYEATRFLYTGSAPAQTGVTNGIIDRRCVAALRGSVIDQDGQPLPGVVVAIKDQPDFGQTLTDANGVFNLVLNGGKTVVVEYEKSGYLSVQRQVVTQRRQFDTLEAVVLIPPDPQTTLIDPASTATFQVAQGSVISDGSGSRKATLLFPAGAMTTYLERAGVKRPLTTLTFRATEFTDGVTGASAMPGDLPPNSGYSYAVDFSFDELAGTGSVPFDQPVINYTENFLGIPVGTPVPAGYYDNLQAKWIPADNGRVIKILSISGGLANLDVTGDGIADTGQILTDLGITDSERQQLAGLYSAGQELWRTPIPHFSPWDFNWPFGPPADAEEPPTPPENNEQPNECTEAGSVINCEAQTLGESLPVVGTPFTLNYSSERVPGWKAGNMLDLPIVAGDLPASLRSVFLQAEIGGQMMVRKWSRASVGQPFEISGLYSGTVEALTPNLNTRLVWNGQDAYGRLTNGRPIANVYVHYVYDYAYYTANDQFQQSFAQFGENLLVTNGREYCQYLDYPPASAVAAEFCGINIYNSYSRALGYWDASAAVGLGGWTLDIHHAYDFNDGVLHLGDGTDLSRNDIGPVVTAVTPENAAINYLGNLTVAPDGSIYFIDGFEKKIMRLEADGSLTHIAGNGNQGYPTGDGGPATQAILGWYFNALAFGPDGAVYLATTYDNFNVGLIRRIDPDGTISTIAGTYFNQSSLPNLDGGPAVDARLNNPEDILFGPDGSLYISETPLYRYAGGNFNRIRKIDPNGIITTIAGAGGNFSATADLTGVRALDWGAFPAPMGMAFGPQGDLYVTHPGANTVSRIGPDGVLWRLAGSGGSGNTGDGGQALNAAVGSPLSVAVDENGIVYVRTRYYYYDRVRRISADGRIVTYAGRDCDGPRSNNGYAARQACLSNFGSNNNMELAPDGGLLISSTRGRIERIAAPQAPGSFTAQNILIPDPNGALVYEFSSAGRHLRTLSALTGAALYTFGYDSAGRLLTITDADNNVTQIERNGSGQPTAIVASGGQRTPLTLTASGYLRTVANPAGNTTTLAYDTNGLLTSLTDPRGGVHHYTYDPDGRLLTDQNAAGYTQTLSRLEQPGLTQVTRTTGLGQTTTYATETLPNGDRLRTVTAPDGTTTSVLISDGSVWTLTLPDGTIQAVTYAPDPRWGMNAPIAASVLVTTTGSLTYEATTARTAVLSNPANPFTLTSLEDQVTVNGSVWRYAYTAANRAIAITTPEGRVTQAALDAAGRLLTYDPDGGGPLAATALTYDTRGRLTQIAQPGRTEQFGYNAANWLTSQTGPDGRSAALSYDLAGRLTTAVLPGSRTVAFAYDANSNQTSLTPPGKPAHTFTYAADDQPTGYTPPTVSGGGSYGWGYDADRSLTSVARPGGGSVSVGYLDNGFRLGSVTLARGARGYTYDAAGRLATTSDPSGVNLSYTYDGPMLTNRAQTGPVPGAVGFAYNAQWLTGAITVNGANPIAYTYDDDALVTGAGGLTIARQPQNGLVTGSTLGSVTDAWTYNAFGEATGYTASSGGSSVYQVAWTRDVNGRITQSVETIGGATTTYAYAYDAAGRLSEVRQNGAVIGAYTYDANGNRLTAGGVTSAFDAQDRLTQVGTTQFTYTAAGELASKTAVSGTTTYQYDEEGNLMAVSLPGGNQITYLVDALNRRVGKRVNGTLVQGFCTRAASSRWPS
ncbi:MAG: carboxypeptidase regulatory-like domain-containing protein [Chloroflexi bacterium]|nr:carboxypeptidase regulatory-like domain-containing protein [Chloroflexota bacterium]